MTSSIFIQFIYKFCETDPRTAYPWVNRKHNRYRPVWLNRKLVKVIYRGCQIEPPRNFIEVSLTGPLWRRLYQNEFLGQVKFWGGGTKLDNHGKSKIRFHSFVGLDLENRLSTHNMVIFFF